MELRQGPVSLIQVEMARRHTLWPCLSAIKSWSLIQGAEGEVERLTSRARLARGAEGATEFGEEEEGRPATIH